MGSITDKILDSAIAAAVSEKPKQVSLVTKPVGRLVHDGEDRWTLMLYILASEVGTPNINVTATFELKLLEYGKQALAPSLKMFMAAAEQLIKDSESNIIPASQIPNPNGQGS